MIINHSYCVITRIIDNVLSEMIIWTQTMCCAGVFSLLKSSDRVWLVIM